MSDCVTPQRVCDIAGEIEVPYVTIGDATDDSQWSLIEPQLWEVKENANADWTPDDIRRMCVNLEAYLFMLASGGFYVLQLLTNEFTGELYVFVLAGGRTYEEADTAAPFVIQFAKDSGAKYIEMYATRRGHERRGWELQDIRFRRRV